MKTYKEWKELKEFGGDFQVAGTQQQGKNILKQAPELARLGANLAQSISELPKRVASNIAKRILAALKAIEEPMEANLLTRLKTKLQADINLLDQAAQQEPQQQAPW